MNWMSLSAETPRVIRDENGVPVEWTLLKTGKNPYLQDGIPGSIDLTRGTAFSGESVRAVLAPYPKGRRSAQGRFAAR